MPSLTGYSLKPAFVRFNGLLALEFTRSGPSAIFALEKGGRLLEVRNGSPVPVLDLSADVNTAMEAGALGIALHPRFNASPPVPYIYVWYNAKDADGSLHQRLGRFTWDPALRTFGRTTEVVLIDQVERSPIHNAGRIQFGPDGFLYFSNGDDSQSVTPQTIEGDLFSGVFRIDVDQKGGSVSHPPPRQPAHGKTQGYYIPNDNPFVGRKNVLEEFYALGLRNPYGLSFDRATGDLWCPDVGDARREELNRIVPAGNYGWPLWEGELATGRPGRLLAGTTARPPVFAYSHWEVGDISSIIGGYVYRGKRFPDLVGHYIYSDWRSGRVWALDLGRTPPVRRDLVANNHMVGILAHAEDSEGEIYFLSWPAAFRLERDTAEVPRRLSETGLFDDLGALASRELVPYTINSPLWSDGAEKRRWFSLPAGQKAQLIDGDVLRFPTGSVAVKHFELPSSFTPKDHSRRLETRVLVVGDEVTYGLTYKWNAAGTDAELVTSAQDETYVDDRTRASIGWRYFNMTDCWACHRRRTSRLLGLTFGQLNRPLDIPREPEKNQLLELASRGLFAFGEDESFAVRIGNAYFLPHTPNPASKTHDVEARALGYLASNCGGCHSTWSGPRGLSPYAGSKFLKDARWIATPGVPLEERGLVNVQTHNKSVSLSLLGVPDAKLIEPGAPERSLLLARMASRDPDLRMPPLGRNLVDEAAVALVAEWIRGMPQR